MNQITNIQKFSIHDGDGIRTTVFFKGCPLKCIWCHNPETQRYDKEIEFKASDCVSCGACARACPHDAISITEQCAETDPNKCRLCDKCTVYCPKELRSIIGREYTAAELVKELKKDLMFYEDSGGGVTLSGGEVMAMDKDFILDIVRRLHREEINVAIDTTGFAPYEKFEAILPYVDTFLYDVKVMDNELHRKFIGAGNELILENLRRLAKAGARIYIRIPTIKGVSGTRENMQATIDFLKSNEINPPQINLLPYHDTGSHKYSKIGREYLGYDLQAPSTEEMNEYLRMFKDAGFANTRIGG